MVKASPVLKIERSLFREVDSGWRSRGQERRIQDQLRAAGKAVTEAPADPGLRESGHVLAWTSEALTRLVQEGALAADLNLQQRPMAADG